MNKQKLVKKKKHVVGVLNNVPIINKEVPYQIDPNFKTNSVCSFSYVNQSKINLKFFISKYEFDAVNLIKLYSLRIHFYDSKDKAYFLIDSDGRVVMFEANYDYPFYRNIKVTITKDYDNKIVLNNVTIE